MWFIGVEEEQETSALRPKKKSWIRPCNQTVNLKRDSKTLYYSIQYNSPSILNHNKG